MLENVYKDLNACYEVYLSKEYFCKMYLTSKLCEFILFPLIDAVQLEAVCVCNVAIP